MAAAKKKNEALPNLHNATQEFLVDELGEVRAEMKKLEKREAFYKEALLARVERKPGEYKGEKYYAILTNESRTGLNTQQIKEEMGEDWVADHSKTTDYQKLSVKEVPNE